MIFEEKYVHPSVRGMDSWNELNLKHRQGLKRLSYFCWCDVKDTHEFVTSARQARDQHTFIFPHFLNHTHHAIFEFDGIHEEMLIDVRDEADISDLKNNVSRRSLTSEFTVIRQRPEIVA